METFQEGGVSGDVPVGAGAVAIQKALNLAHPDALWFMMAWQGQPPPGADRLRRSQQDFDCRHRTGPHPAR
jgi:hypothetical protein